MGRFGLIYSEIPSGCGCVNANILTGFENVLTNSSAFNKYTYTLDLINNLQLKHAVHWSGVAAGA